MLYDTLHKAYYIGNEQPEENPDVSTKGMVPVRVPEIRGGGVPGFLARSFDNNIRSRLIQMSILEIIS